MQPPGLTAQPTPVAALEYASPAPGPRVHTAKWATSKGHVPWPAGTKGGVAMAGVSLTRTLRPIGACILLASFALGGLIPHADLRHAHAATARAANDTLTIG